MLGELDDGALVGTALVWQQVRAQRAPISPLVRHAVGVAISSQEASSKRLSPQWLLLGELDDGALVGTALVWQQVRAQRASISPMVRHAVGVAISSQVASSAMLSPQWLLTMAAGVGAADEAEGEPVTSSSTTV